MPSYNHKIRLGAASLLAMLLGSYLFSATADASELRDISKVNSGIRVSAEEHVGDISSVNGGIRMARGSSAYELGTVNGGIDLDDGVIVRHAETVNGGIRVGQDVTINGSLETVNGGIRTEQGTVVDNRIRTVNGRIVLRNTVVRENVQTSNGDIEIRDGSTIEGDIVVRGRRSWFQNIFNWNRKPSDLTIDADSSVKGDIHLYREVNLHIDDDAEVGEVVRHY